MIELWDVVRVSVVYVRSGSTVSWFTQMSGIVVGESGITFVRTDSWGGVVGPGL